MALFSCIRCVHFTGGQTPRCQRGFALTTTAPPERSTIPLVVIDEGCDEFTVSLRSAVQKTGGGGPLRRSAKLPALRGAARLSRHFRPAALRPAAMASRRN